MEELEGGNAVRSENHLDITDGECNMNNISAWLTWNDLTVSVPVKNGEKHNVLDGLTGYAEPGTVTALMGPSGSGKSCLLDALAGCLASNVVLSGKVLLNGRKLKKYCGVSAYVKQQDDLIGTLTVRETISYSAQLRLPDKMPLKEKQDLIEGTIAELGLEECANIVIGNWHLRGISGGERRRVSIALQILTKPSLLFLDEPTSGLDSASAFFVMQTLWSLSRGGRTIIASLHQPSSQLFELLDQLCLLTAGKAVYFGKASEAHEFFAQSGFPCPHHRNPADHFIRSINTDFDKVKASLQNSSKLSIGSVHDPLNMITAKETRDRLIKYYKRTNYSNVVRDKAEEIAKINGTMEQLGSVETSFLMQCLILTKRSFVNMSRDFGYYWLRFIIYILVVICTGSLFFDVGTKFSSIRTRGSSSYFLLNFLTFMSIGGFPSFIDDMKVSRKERLNGHYGVSAFVISNALSALPFLVLITFLSGTICYFMMNLHSGFSHYLFFVLCLFASVSAVESMMMAVTTVVPNFITGLITGAGLQGIFMMASGFVRLPSDMPKPFWRYPMTYLSFHYWAMQGLYKNDLEGLYFDNVTPDLPEISGEYLLKDVFQIHVDRSKWLDLSVIFSMIIFYRIMCFAMIKMTEDLTPYLKGHITRWRLKNKESTSFTIKSQVPV